MLSAALILLAASSTAWAQSPSATASGEEVTGLFSFAPTGTSSRENTPVGTGIGYTPLNRQNFTYGELPNKVDTARFGRGPQSGINICNETTVGPESQCQTAIVNSIEDFCLWGLPDLATVGDREAAAVAYCTTPEHGSRVIPDGTIKAAQWTYTPEYIQITGLLDQTQLLIEAGDYGGEMDPVGEDYRGNPLGGLMFSNVFSEDGSIQQVPHWTQFIGSDHFCLRLCQPGSYNATLNCEHIYDRIGCQYNMPHDVQEEGEFEVCYGELGLPAGRYYDDFGNLQTYTQPPVEAGPITTVPYTPMTPSSSNCSAVTSTPAAFFDPSNPSVAASAAPVSSESAAPLRRAVRWARNGM